MSVRVFYEILNQRGTPAMFTDTLANRPTFGFAGRLFVSTDSGQIFEDTGSAWTLVADAGVGGGTLSSVCLNGNTTATGIVITAGGLSTNSLTNTSLTTGSILFSGASGLISQSNATFFWDNTNKRLGIGTATPSAPLDIHATGTNATFNGTGSNNAYLQFQNAGVSKWRIGNTYSAGANSFDIYNNGLANTPLSINSATNLITLSANVTTTGIQAIQNGLNLGYASGGATASYTNMSGSTTGINFALANGTGGASFIFPTAAGYNYTFPATTGTLALTSDISGYLPLTGGSLTGNLSTNSYISIQNGLGTNQIYLTKSSGDVYGTIQTEAGGNKFSLGNVSNIGTLGTPNITWTSGAQVGINNSSPSYELDVTGTFRTTGRSLLTGNVGIGAATTSTTLYVYSSTNTVELRLERGGTGDVGARWKRNGSDIGYISNADWIIPSTSSTDFAVNAVNNLLFGTSSTEKMRITSSGNILIGTSTDAGTANLQVQQTANSGYAGIRLANTLGNWWTSVVAANTNYYFNYQGSGVGYINSSTGAYIPISDINKKKDFEISTIGLNEILGLKPTLYRMKNDNQFKPKQLGFIAQEVKDFIPQAYIESINEEDTFIGLNQMPIIAALVKSIQELNAILVKNNIN